MESFQIVFLSSEKRGWAWSPVFWSKMDEMFPPFWADESSGIGVDGIMVKTWNLERDWGWEGGLCTPPPPVPAVFM